MDNISGGMKSLCEDIATSHGDRKRSIKDLKEQARGFRDYAREVRSHCRKVQRKKA